MWLDMVLYMYKLFHQIIILKIKKMRQLKGKTKETNKQKKERKKEFLENKQRVFTVVLPTIAAIFVVIAAYVYVKTRPKVVEY